MASIQYVVNATDAASSVFQKIGLSADNLDRQLEDLSKRIATPEVNLDDSKFTLGMIRAAERLDKLSEKVADPSVEVDTAKAQVEILRINAMLDRLDAKRVTPTVSVDVDRGGFLSRLGGLFGTGGAGGLASLGGAGGFSLGPIGWGAAIAGALALSPAAIPLALGGAAGLGGGVLAGTLGTTGLQKLRADRLRLQRAQLAIQAPGPASATQRLALRQAQAQFARDQGLYGGFVPFGRQVTQLGNTGLGTLLGALTGTGPGFSGGGPGGTRNASFLQGLTGILKQVGDFVKSIGPQLGDLFRASLPFVQAFVKVMEQFAKAVLPSVTQSLKILQPDLPTITQGFKYLSQGIAGFIKNLGPGIKDSAIIFKASMLVIKGFLQLTGLAAADFAKGIVKTAEIVRAVARGIPPFFDKMRHDIANIFDGVRHDAAAAWDAIWNNTVARVQHGVTDVNRWFNRLPGLILGALRGLGHSLYAFARSALTDFLNGAKSVAGSIFDWAKNFITSLPGQFMKWLHMSPPHPGSAFFDLGANMMHHMEAGMRSRAQNIGISAIAGGLTGGAGVQQWRGTVLRALAMEGLSPMLLGRVLYQMQTESGGRANAINLWDSNAAAGDPSRGLMQVIGSTFAAYHWPGTSWNIFDPLANIAAALNYARHRYGPSLMSGGMGIGSGRGYATGSWNVPYTGPAVVHQGEMIIPAAAAAAVRAGAGSGNTYNITVNVPPSANKADVGRQVVETIREYERRSGAGWRK